MFSKICIQLQNELSKGQKLKKVGIFKRSIDNTWNESQNQDSNWFQVLLIVKGMMVLIIWMAKKKDLVTEVQTQKMFHHDLNSVFRLATKFKGFGMQLIK